ncbi:amino acid permease [Pseudomonas aeruginosa]
MSKVVLASQLPNKRNASLAPGLKQRHVTMLSIAGVIGAGLFVGSGHAIAAAGPAALLAYLIAGTLVVLVMRMLGEMAVASPDTGSFSTYADRSIGRWAGFTIGWLYWWFWVLVIPLEAIAAAAILNAWFPAIDTWIFALAVTFLLTVTNLFSVARYGEFEFWFALLKVIAIIAFIVLGAVAIVGGLPEREVSGLSSLMASHGGFVPNGYGAVLGALLTTMFSFMGTEIVTIAAAESKDPAKQITRATNSVIWRIGLFYLVSIFIVISIVPWNDPLLIQVGSYQRALELLDIPHAKRGDAPSVLKLTNTAHVPRPAVLASTAVGFLTTIVNYFAPEKVFTFLLASSGAVALLVYLVIAVAQLRMRKQLQASGQPIEFRMWLYPWLTWAVILFIVAALSIMLIMPEHRHEVFATALLTIFTVCLGLLNARRKPRLGEDYAGKTARV